MGLTFTLRELGKYDVNSPVNVSHAGHFAARLFIVLHEKSCNGNKHLFLRRSWFPRFTQSRIRIHPQLDLKFLIGVHHFLANFEWAVSCRQSAKASQNNECGVDGGPQFLPQDMNGIGKNLISFLPEPSGLPLTQIQRLIVLNLRNIGMSFVHPLVKHIFIFFVDCD